ncbi:MAG: hypothetical protein J3K34DRAFT_411762 [Monoraphidium minutum]|nr:MAG: hypothetical protein J3K34DRAFT_411762 [Monoraphidium minutum]
MCAANATTGCVPPPRTAPAATAASTSRGARGAVAATARTAATQQSDVRSSSPWGVVTKHAAASSMRGCVSSCWARAGDCSGITTKRLTAQIRSKLQGLLIISASASRDAEHRAPVCLGGGDHARAGGAQRVGARRAARGAAGGEQAGDGGVQGGGACRGGHGGPGAGEGARSATLARASVCLHDGVAEARAHGRTDATRCLRM